MSARVYLLGLALLPTIVTAQLPPGFSDTAWASGLTLPVAMDFGSDGRLWVAHKGGAIKIVQNGSVVATFATINVSSNSERGLLGIALDPSFPSDPYVYVYYTTSATSFDPPATPKNRVSRLTANGNAMEPNSEVVLLDEIPSDAGNHNAGCIRFAPDGTLFISTGDGGSTPGNSQNLGNLAGKILRINQDGSIPASNPFFGSLSARNEIWCYGLRNPFRFDFRPGTQIPYIGDVGQSAWEEVNVGVAGGNYGWNTFEGPTNEPGYISPAYAYPFTDTLRGSITGGVFMVGKRFPPPYDGSYFYGDYVRDHIRRLTFNGSQVNTGNFDFTTVTDPVDFAEGPDGALYYISLTGGTVRRIAYKTSFTNFTINPTMIPGDFPTIATVTLDHPAPAAGALILLSSNNPVASPGASIRIPGGQTQRTFKIFTTPTETQQVARITGTRHGVTRFVDLTVTPSSDSEYISTTVPTAMNAGQSYVVSVTMRNNGFTTWTHAAGYRLASREPPDNTRWGKNRMFLGGASVPPGSSFAFTTTVTAPSTPGTYIFRWKMLLDGVGTFGDEMPIVNVEVS